MIPETKCIVRGCNNNGKVWVNKDGPYCYTHHHEFVNIRKRIQRDMETMPKKIELDPLK